MANVIALFMILLIVPGIIGMLYAGSLPEDRRSMLLGWAAGFVILWGIFEVVALPLIFQRQSLDLLCMIYGGIVILLAVISVFANRRKMAMMAVKGIASLRSLPVMGWVNLLLVLGQAYVYVRYLHIDEDDALYVGAATTAVSTNTIFSVSPYTGMEYATLPTRYVLSPFFSFVAFLSRISGVHPAVTAHVVLAATLIILSYAVYALLGRKLFSGQPAQAAYFLFFVILLTLFSGYTVYTQGMFTLVRIWQGKAVLCAILVPMAFYMMLHLWEGESVRADWLFLLLLMCACCMVSSMGIMLGAVMLGIFGILSAARNKSIKMLIYTALCCIPNMICAAIYLAIH